MRFNCIAFGNHFPSDATLVVDFDDDAAAAAADDDDDDSVLSVNEIGS